VSVDKALIVAALGNGADTLIVIKPDRRAQLIAA